MKAQLGWGEFFQAAMAGLALKNQAAASRF
jgi:hypothetical protein